MVIVLVILLLSYYQYYVIVLQVSDGDKKPTRQISRTVHDTLADIFKKIGSKENTREVCISCSLYVDYRTSKRF